jgi:hypothetical protein
VNMRGIGWQWDEWSVKPVFTVCVGDMDLDHNLCPMHGEQASGQMGSD